MAHMAAPTTNVNHESQRSGRLAGRGVSFDVIEALETELHVIGGGRLGHPRIFRPSLLGLIRGNSPHGASARRAAEHAEAAVAAHCPPRP
jgi:hypothetical protein